MMAGIAVVNGVGEELLWRGAYLDTFPEDAWRGAVWPWVGFTLWHPAPQIVFPLHAMGGPRSWAGRPWWERHPRGSPGPRGGYGGHRFRISSPTHAGSGRRCSGGAEPITGNLRTDSTSHISGPVRPPRLP
jgi:hypothetical protein